MSKTDNTLSLDTKLSFTFSSDISEEISINKTNLYTSNNTHYVLKCSST